TEPVPADYPTLSPYICVDGAAEAIAFYVDVLGATERMRMGGPEGKIGHAELAIGNSVLMLSDEWPDAQFFNPRSVGGTPVTLSVYVPDADATFAKAVAAGSKPLREVSDHFYGDRSGQVEDPWGHRWNVSTHVEDVSAEEMQRRAAAAMGSP
nr:VOC family protein [Micromonospora sp. DSM 115978]